MKSFTEKRTGKRDSFEAPIIYNYLSSRNFQNGRMCNNSECGLYFESSQPVYPGTRVNVKAVDFCSIIKCRVVWCRKTERKGLIVYGIGLRLEE